MKCIVCNVGTVKKGFTTITFERDNMVIVFQNVPAKICNTCGEGTVSDEICGVLLDRAEKESSGIGIKLLKYAA